MFNWETFQYRWFNKEGERDMVLEDTIENPISKEEAVELYKMGFYMVDEYEQKIDLLEVF